MTNIKFIKKYLLLSVLFVISCLTFAQSVTVEWVADCGTGVINASSPALSNDGSIVYFANGAGGKLYAINTSNGIALWNFSIGVASSNPARTSTTVGQDGIIYVPVGSISSTNTPAYLYAINPNGQEKWKYNIGTGANIAYISPAIAASGDILIGNTGTNGSLHVIDTTDGTRKAYAPIPSGVLGTIVVSQDNIVYTQSGSNGFNAHNLNKIEKPKIIVSNSIPCIGEEVQFSYQANITGSPKWSFGDGTYSTDAAVKHIFMENGSYDVSLEISDIGGEITITTVSIQVMGKRLTDELVRLINNPSEIWVCAHRANTLYGIQNGIPENSIEAIQKAIEVGANMVEIDVRITSDGHFVLMHDATLNRTTNSSGSVSGKTLAQLKSYKLKDANGILTNCTIPTLEEALIAGRGKIYFNMDKVGDISSSSTLQRLVALIDSLNMFDRAMFYVSGNRSAANEIRYFNPKSIIFPWAETSSAISSWSSFVNTNLIQLDYREADIADVINEARSKKMVCYSNTLYSAGDNQMQKGNYSSINRIKLLQLQVIQTDYSEIVIAQITQ